MFFVHETADLIWTLAGGPVGVLDLHGIFWDVVWDPKVHSLGSLLEQKVADVTSLLCHVLEHAVYKKAQSP